MAIENAKTLNVRIRNKYDSYENWAASSLVLEAGEIAIAYTTVNVTVDNGTAKHPALLMKVGNGTDTFANLPWLSAKAADVLSACKSEEALTEFVNNVIADAGIASDEAMEALAGRVTTAEGKVTTLEGKMTTAEGKISTAEEAIAALEAKFGADTVALEIEAAINALNLANTYAAKVHTHEIADVNGLADSIAAAKKAGTDANAALEAYKTLNDAAVKVNSDAIAGIKNGTTIDNFAEVEEALAGKQAAGDYATKAEAQAMADGKDAAIAAAKKAGDDAASAAAQSLVDAKAYTDTEMERLVGDTKVSEQISGAIADLDLANTYDAKGAAADAETAAKGHADDLNTAMDNRVKALEAIDHDHDNKTVLDGITAEKVAAWDAAEQNAKDYADGLDEVMDGRVAALEAKFTGEDSVADQISDAVAAETSAREEAVAGLQEQVTANAGAIEALDAEVERLTGGVVVAEAIEAAVKVEKERAEGIEAGLEGRLAAVEADYLTSVEEKALQDQITANASAIELLTNGVSADEVDGVNDLIKYVKDHGTEVTGIKADIKANADDIDALEGRMDAAETAIGTKAAQTDLDALDERVEAVETELNTADTGLKARMTAAEEGIAALDDLVGDKKVSVAIEEAIEALKIGDYAKAADLTAAISQHNTDKAALEAEIAKKANDADLAAIAKTGSTDDLVQGTMTLVFDCGTSAV